MSLQRIPELSIVVHVLTDRVVVMRLECDRREVDGEHPTSEAILWSVMSLAVSAFHWITAVAVYIAVVAVTLMKYPPGTRIGGNAVAVVTATLV